MSLAKKIVQLRKERNLTQKQLARIVGVHFSHLSRYERELSLPSIDVVKKLARMFGVSADYLLFDDSDAMIRANIADQELLQQFERVALMSDEDKAVVKTVLEGIILKHHIEEMLGVKRAATPLSGDATVEARASSWSKSALPEVVLKRLNGTLQRDPN